MKKFVLGFTLIELLIAISIVAIISAVGFVSYSQTQSFARDSRRKQDLRSIQTALELYYQKNKRYPCSSFWQKSSDSDFWIQDLGCTTTEPFDKDYINFMPKDPRKDDNPLIPNNTGYSYHMGSISGFCPGNNNSNQYYILLAGLENQKDMDSNLNKNYADCNNEAVTSSPNAYVLTSP